MIVMCVVALAVSVVALAVSLASLHLARRARPDAVRTVHTVTAEGTLTAESQERIDRLARRLAAQANAAPRR